MTRLFPLAAFLFAALLTAPATAQPPDWTGDWNAALTIPGGTQLRLIVTIAAAPDGGLTGQLESIDQAPGQKIPIC